MVRGPWVPSLQTEVTTVWACRPPLILSALGTHVLVRRRLEGLTLLVSKLQVVEIASTTCCFCLEIGAFIPARAGSWCHSYIYICIYTCTHVKSFKPASCTLYIIILYRYISSTWNAQCFLMSRQSKGWYLLGQILNTTIGTVHRSLRAFAKARRWQPPLQNVGCRSRRRPIYPCRRKLAFEEASCRIHFTQGSIFAEHLRRSASLLRRTGTFADPRGRCYAFAEGCGSSGKFGQHKPSGRSASRYPDLQISKDLSRARTSRARVFKSLINLHAAFKGSNLRGEWLSNP